MKSITRPSPPETGVNADAVYEDYMMKLPPLLILAAVLHGCLAPVALAQPQRPKARTAQPPAASRPEPQDVDPLGWQVEESYDKFSDRSHLSVGPMTLPTADRSQLGVVALWDYEGQARPKSMPPPPAGYVYLAFVAQNARHKFNDYHELVILADGKRMNFGELKYSSKLSPPYVEERMSLFLTPEAILELSSAKTVECRLGQVEFSLPERHKKLLAEFLGRLPPAPTGDEPPPLELTRLSHRELAEFLEFTGEVKNVSEQNLGSLTGHVECEPKSGSGTKRFNLLVVAVNLRPGETVKFNGIGLADGADPSRCEVTFTDDYGNVVRHAKAGNQAK